MLIFIEIEQPMHMYNVDVHIKMVQNQKDKKMNTSVLLCFNVVLC